MKCYNYNFWSILIIGFKINSYFSVFVCRLSANPVGSYLILRTCLFDPKIFFKLWLALMTESQLCKQCCLTDMLRQLYSSLLSACPAVCLLECLPGDSSVFSTSSPSIPQSCCCPPLSHFVRVWSVCRGCWFKAFPCVIPAVWGLVCGWGSPGPRHRCR